MSEKEPNDGGSPMGGYAKYSAMGFQMIVIIGGFTYGGHRIDQAYHHTTQWAPAALSLVGVFIALFIIIRAVKN